MERQRKQAEVWSEVVPAAQFANKPDRPLLLGYGRHNGAQSPQSALVPQKPNDNPVVAKNAERLAGPANSVPRPTSQTIEGVNW